MCAMAAHERVLLQDCTVQEAANGALAACQACAAAIALAVPLPLAAMPFVYATSGLRSAYRSLLLPLSRAQLVWLPQEAPGWSPFRLAEIDWSPLVGHCCSSC